MRVSEVLQQRLLACVSSQRIIAWYDGQRAFAGFVARLQLPNTGLVSGANSAPAARRAAVNHDRYWLSVINLLADFALFAGVGAGTSMGLGQCRRIADVERR